jgi:hypothetical protein
MLNFDKFQFLKTFGQFGDPEIITSQWIHFLKILMSPTIFLRDDSATIFGHTSVGIDRGKFTLAL